MLTLDDALDLHGYNHKNHRNGIPFMIRRSKNKDVIYTKYVLNSATGPKGLKSLPVIKVTVEKSNFYPYCSYEKHEKGKIKVFWLDDSNYTNYSRTPKKEDKTNKEDPDSYIYKCLERYGNTVVGKVHFYKMFKHIWHEKIGKHTPSNVMDDPRHSKDCEICMNVLKENIGEKIGKRVGIRRVVSTDRPEPYTRGEYETSEFFVIEVASDMQK